MGRASFFHGRFDVVVQARPYRKSEMVPKIETILYFESVQ